LRRTGLGLGAGEELFEVGAGLFTLLLFGAAFGVEPCDLTRGGRRSTVREEQEREESEAHAYRGGSRRETVRRG
jgi:hypothetical protein